MGLVAKGAAGFVALALGAAAFGCGGGGSDGGDTSGGNTDTDAPATGTSSTTLTTSAGETTASTSTTTTGSPTNPTTTMPPMESTGSTAATDDTSATDSIPEGCGNDEPDDGEECDDGNTEDGDGCNADCTVSGAVIWSHAFASGFGTDETRSVAVGDDGGVFVIGRIGQASSGTEIWLRRYADNGAIEWTTTRDGGAEGNDLGHDILFDGDSIVVSGSLTVSSGFGNGVDGWYARYSPAGVMDWEQTFSGFIPGPNGFELPGTDRALGAALAPDGSLAFSGILTVNSQSTNVWVRKTTAAADTVWEQTFNGAASVGDRAEAVGIDADGNVVVAGYEGLPASELIAWLRKYDPDGVVVWTQTYAGPDTADDRFLDVAVADDGTIFVCGYEGDSAVESGERWWVRAYDEDGVELWSESDDGETGEGAMARQLTILDSGDLAVVGHELVNGTTEIAVRRYDADGNERWARRFDELGVGAASATGVVGAPDGGLYVVGSVDFGVDAEDAWIARMTP